MLTEEKGLKNNSKVLGLGTVNIMAIYCFGGIRRDLEFILGHINFTFLLNLLG